MAETKVCPNVSPLMAERQRLIENSPDVQRFLALEKEIASAKKMDVPDLISMRESGAIPSNAYLNYGPVSVGFKSPEHVVASAISTPLLMAIVENNPDGMRAALTATIIKDAVANANGRKTENAKRVQRMNLGKVLESEFVPQIGMANPKYENAPDEEVGA